MRRFLVLTIAFLTLLALAIPVGAEGALEDRITNRSLPDSVVDLKLDNPLALEGALNLDVLEPSLSDATGPQSVIIRLRGDSLASAGIAGDAAQAAYVRSLNRTQDRFLARIARP